MSPINHRPIKEAKIVMILTRTRIQNNSGAEHITCSPKRLSHKVMFVSYKLMLAVPIGKASKDQTALPLLRHQSEEGPDIISSFNFLAPSKLSFFSENSTRWSVLEIKHHLYFRCQIVNKQTLILVFSLVSMNLSLRHKVCS